MEMLLRRSCGGFVAVNPFLTNRTKNKMKGKNENRKNVFRVKSPNCHRLMSVRAGAERISSFVFNSKALCANDDDENVEYIKRVRSQHIIFYTATQLRCRAIFMSGGIIQMPKCNNGVEVIRNAA